MKNVFLAMIFAGITAISVQAQTYFAGGSIGANYDNGKYSYGSSSTNRPSTFSLDFSPMLGIYVDEKIGVGVMLNLGMNIWNDRREEPTKDKKYEWGAGTFMRYTMLTRGDFSILIQGGAGIFGNFSKSTSGTTTNDGPKYFGFDISVMPLLSYSLTSNVSIEARSNLAKFGFTRQTEKRGTGDSLVKETESSFGFGLDCDDFFRSPYQLGLIFKF